MSRVTRLAAVLVAAMLLLGGAGSALASPSSPPCDKPAQLLGERDEAYPGYVVMFHQGADAAEEVRRLASRYSIDVEAHAISPNGFFAKMPEQTAQALRCEPAVWLVQYDDDINHWLRARNHQKLKAEAERWHWVFLYPGAVLAVALITLGLRRGLVEAVLRAATWAPVLSGLVVFAFEMGMTYKVLLASGLFYAVPLLTRHRQAFTPELIASGAVYLTLVRSYSADSTLVAFAVMVLVAIAAAELGLAMLLLRRRFQRGPGLTAAVLTVWAQMLVGAAFLLGPDHFKGMDAAFAAGAGAGLLAAGLVLGALASLVVFPATYWWLASRGKLHKEATSQPEAD